MSNAVNQEIDQKLQDFYQIRCAETLIIWKPNQRRLSAFFRTGALLSDDSSLKMELLANLLYLYDATWSLEQEGARVVVGHAYHVMQQLPEDMKKPAIVRKIRKWLTLSELGHLLGEGPNIVESRKFGRSVLTDIRVCFFFKNINIVEENPIKLSLFPPRCFQYYNFIYIQTSLCGGCGPLPFSI